MQKPEVIDEHLKPKRSILGSCSAFKSNPKNCFQNLPKKKLLLWGSIMLVLALIVGLATYTISVAKALEQQARTAEAVAYEAYEHFKNQDLNATGESLAELRKQVAALANTYQRLSFYGWVPGVNAYYQDGWHLIHGGLAGLSAAQKGVWAATPYADVLGFEGEGSFEGGTAEDRLQVVLETLDKISPVLDDITADLLVVEQELNSINPDRYPENIQNTPLRAYILQAQDLGAGVATAMTEFRPVIEVLPKAAGNNEPKKYLILFQNDNELRPTGGFLTAYAIVNVENGKVEPEKSDDIYELDRRFRAQLPIPEELGRYLTTERYWNLRDMNTSPDFFVSMSQFYENYQTVPGEPTDLDGIIAVDTQVLTALLQVLGPVEVPGFGTFSAEIDPRCDCPQIIYVLSEIITRPTPYIRENRKGIIGPLMRAILNKAYAAPRQQWPELFELGLDYVAGRHIQFYFLDENVQKAAEVAEAAGRLVPPEEGVDFLAIINANLAGAKSNLFTHYEVEQVIESQTDGWLQKTVTITYRNTRPADNCDLEAGLLCLNATLRDWTRLYVPAGSRLIEAQGFSEEARVYEENGFSVIDGFFILEPLGVARLRLTYEVPYQDSEQYKAYFWKQGGVNEYSVLLDVLGDQVELVVDQDTIYQTPFY